MLVFVCAMVHCYLADQTRDAGHFSTRTSKGCSFSHEVKSEMNATTERLVTLLDLCNWKMKQALPPLCSHRGICFLGSNPSIKNGKACPFGTQKLAMISVSMINDELRTTILQPDQRNSNRPVTFSLSTNIKKLLPWLSMGENSGICPIDTNTVFGISLWNRWTKVPTLWKQKVATKRLTPGSN